MIPELHDRNRREIIVYQYRLMHRVEVLRVVHGRRPLVNVPGSCEELPAEYTAA